MNRKLSVGLMAAAIMVVPTTAALADSHDGDATVWAVHAVPGVDVDVWANGDPLIEGFSPTDADSVTVPAGDYDLEVYPAGSDPAEEDPVITWSGEVPAGANVTLVAHLDAEGEIAPELALFANDTSELAAGETAITARHTAAAPEVELLAGGDVVDSFAVGGELGPLAVPAGTLPVGIALPGDEPFFEADLDLAEGAATFVHAYVSDPEDPTGTFEPIVFSIDVGTAGDEAPAEDTTSDDTDAAETEEMEQPHSVDSGTGGLVESGLPLWVAGLMALGLAGIAAPAVATARRRG